MKNLYIAFDIATKKTGIAVYFQNKLRAYTITKARETLNFDFIEEKFRQIIKESTNVFVVFENLQVGRNGIMFAEMIGAIKMGLMMLSQAYKKPFVSETIRPFVWQREILHTNQQHTDRKGMKEKSIINARNYFDVEKDDDKADAINILLYLLKKNKKELPELI